MRRESESPHDLSSPSGHNSTRLQSSPRRCVHFAPVEHYVSHSWRPRGPTRLWSWKLIMIFYLGINLLLKFDRHMISAICRYLQEFNGNDYIR